MTFKHLALLFFAAVALLASSCKKEDLQSDHKVTSFKATLGGVYWEAESSFSDINDDTDQIMIFGTGGDYSVTMNLTGTGKGNFNLDDDDNDLTIQTSTKEYHYLNGTNGKVTLTLNDKVDNALSGEFSGMLVDTLLDTLLVESGEFTHIKYIDTTSSGSGPGIGTSICTVNSISASVGGNSIGTTFLIGSNLGGLLQIAGSNASTFENLQLIMPDDITAGTYAMDGSGYLGTYTKTVGTTASNYNSVSGTLVIEEHDVTNKAIKGTFSFSAKELTTGEDKEITDGSFCAKYN